MASVISIFFIAVELVCEPEIEPVWGGFVFGNPH